MSEWGRLVRMVILVNDWNRACRLASQIDQAGASQYFELLTFYGLERVICSTQNIDMVDLCTEQLL
jgi:hypothetical protein